MLIADRDDTASRIEDRDRGIVIDVRVVIAERDSNINANISAVLGGYRQLVRLDLVDFARLPIVEHRPVGRLLIVPKNLQRAGRVGQIMEKARVSGQWS